MRISREGSPVGEEEKNQVTARFVNSEYQLLLKRPRWCNVFDTVFAGVSVLTPDFREEYFGYKSLFVVQNKLARLHLRLCQRPYDHINVSKEMIDRALAGRRKATSRPA